MHAMVLPRNEVGKRKRPRQEIEVPLSRQRTKDAIVKQELDDDENGNPSVEAPLEGVVACLSGFEVSRKDELHRMIVSLGGR